MGSYTVAGPMSRSSAERLFGLSLFRDMDGQALAVLEQEVEWLHLPAQEILFEAGEPADSMYVVVSGRLDAFRRDPGGREAVIARLRGGAPVGEMGLFSGAPRAASVRAARDSVVVRLSREGWERLADWHPKILFAISRILIERLNAGAPKRDVTPFPVISIIPATPSAPTEKLAALLVTELSALGHARLVSAKTADTQVGAGCSTAESGRLHERTTAWLDALERGHDFLVLVGDGQDGAWTNRVVRHADIVLIVADATGIPNPHALPMRLRERPSSSFDRRELVLIHPDQRKEPTGARRFLDMIPVAAHHHVRLGNLHDVKRVARFLTGRGVAIALSGGASRGYAHIGVLRALREAGIPIDLVCGTSMGSLIGAQFALGWEPQRIRDELRRGLVERSPFDYTMPIVAAVEGSRFDALLKDYFGDRQIEDTWLRFLCVSASLGRAVPVVHRRGPLWRAVRCSSALPGLLPPVEVDGDFLVDGVFLDNLPATLARDEGRGRTVAVNVIPPVGSTEWAEIAKTGSTLRHMVRMVDPRSKSRVPPIMSLVMQGFFLSTINASARIREEVDLFIEPDTSRFWFLDLACVDDAAAAGYEAAKRAIPGWLKRDPTVTKL